MVIKKLNSLFHKHGRWLFCIITVVIIIAFMDFLTPGSGLGSGCSMSGPEKMQVGTAYGQPVTYGELRDVQRNLQIAYEVIYHSSIRELKPEQLFGFRCMQIKAEKLGITGSDKEVAARIQMLPNFQTNGKFDMAKYKKQLEGLARYGIAEKDLYSALRMMIVGEKMQSELASGIVATPGEVAELYRQANTEYIGQVAQFAAPVAPVKALKFSELNKNDQLKLVEFYKKNRADYSITGTLDVLLVAFPFADFHQEAVKTASLKALQSFYKSNPARFKDAKGKNQSFEMAKNEVAKQFVAEQKRALALAAADDFSVKSSEAISNAEKSSEYEKIFRKSADGLKRVVVEARQVKLDALEIAGIKSAELMRALVAVTGNPVSQVVVVDNKAYVGFVAKRVETRPAKLEEVTAEAYRDMKNQELLAATRAELHRNFTALSKAKTADRAKLFGQLKAKFSELNFSAMKQGKPENMQAAFKALSLKPGEVAEVPATLQLVLLTKRIPADMSKLKGQEAQYEMMIKMQKMQRAVMEFQMELNQQCRFNSAALEGK